VVDAVVPRSELREAVATVNEVAPPDDDADREWRAIIARRIVTVSGFLKTLADVSASDPTAMGPRSSKPCGTSRHCSRPARS
jgi:hypothetical protein